MKIKFITFFLIVRGIVAADTLHIYLNTNTCKSCNLLGKQLEGYSSLHKILYLTANDYRVKDEILESYNLNPSMYELKQVDNNFYKLNDRSYCILQKGKNLKDTFLLGELSKLGAFLKPTIKPLHRLKLDKNIKLSDGAVVSISTDYLLFYDYKLNRIYITHLKNDSIVLIESLNANNFKAEDFFKCNCFDEKLYNYLTPNLVQMNLTKPEIESCHIKNNTLDVMLGFEVGVTSTTTHDTVIFKKLFIYSRDLGTKRSSLTCVSAEGNYETDYILGNKFSVVNYDFIKSGDTLYLPLVSSDSTKKSLFVKQLIAGKKVKSLGITRDLNSLVPSSFKFTFGTGGVFLSRAFNETDYYFIKAPLIYNVATKKTFFIDNPDLLNLLKLDSSYISDAKIINSIAHFLIKINDTWFKKEYDVTTNKLLKSSSLNIEKSINYALFMENVDSFFIFSSNSNEFYKSASREQPRYKH